MRVFKGSFLLRLAVAIILLSHSLHGIFTGTDVNNFGELFLNKIGFAPFGVALAWTVVLGQILTSLLLANWWLRPAAAFNIVVLLGGIATVHWPEGWFVVGGGRNGMEFSFLLIACLLSICLPSNAWKTDGPERLGRVNQPTNSAT